MILELNIFCVFEMYSNQIIIYKNSQLYLPNLDK